MYYLSLKVGDVDAEVASIFCNALREGGIEAKDF